MNKEITKAIKNKTGVSDIKVSKADGVCRFVCDTDSARIAGIDLSAIDSVYVPRISDYSASEWAEIFSDSI